MSSWTEQSPETRIPSQADRERASLLDMVRQESLPTIQKEAVAGAPAFKPLELITIRSPGIFEGEFGVKNNDIIFHFFPPGYAKAARDSLAMPKFKNNFLQTVKQELCAEFGTHRVDVAVDDDVGAIFAKAMGWGDSPYVRELVVKACTAIHLKMGGTPAES